MWEESTQAVEPATADLAGRLARLARLVICTAIGIASAWRAATYTEPAGSSMLAPVMIAFFACAITFTGIAMFCRDDEAG